MEKFNNILYYIIIMGLFLFFAFYYHSHILFVLFFAMAVFPFFSIYITKYIAKKLILNMEINHYTCYTSTEYTLKITVQNPIPLPITGCNIGLNISNFYYPNDIFHYINFSIPAFQSEEILIPISFKMCGCYTAELKSIYINDYLNFKKEPVKANAAYQFNVFPINEETQISATVNELSNEEYLNSQKNNSGTQIDGVRDYIQGDLLKNIHWKLSTKTQDLMVKEFYDSVEDSIIILLELYKPALNNILTVGFSVAENLIKQGHKIHLCWANSGDEQLKKLVISSKEQLKQGFGDIFLSYPTEIATYSLTSLRREYGGQGIIHITARENDAKAVINIL